jgi:hypothetical protein
MPDNTIEWGQGAVNNTNDWGKAKANATNNFGAVYDDSPSLDTNITGSTGAVLSISYSSSAFCEDASDPTPTVTDNVGAGTFSSTAGLVFISTSTGEVDLSASTSGATYLITYTDTNSATATFNLTVNALDDATFAYSASSYSQADADPTPTITGVTGGTFSAGSGLVFVDSGSNTGSSTGEIDLSASTVASYTITYTTAGTCPNTSTQSVEIAAALAQVSNVYSMSFDGVNDSIVLPDAIDLGINSSISVWVNLDNNYDGVLLGCEPYTNQYLIFARHNDFFVRIGSVFKSFPLTDNALTAGSWHHLAVTRNGDSISTYVDGTFIETKTGYGTSVTTKFDTIADRQTSSLPLEGKIDELAGFNVELTAQEVQNIYNATETGKTADLNDLTTPPVKWYRMGD